MPCLLPPKAEMKVPMVPPIEAGYQPVVLCKPGTIGVTMPSANEIIVRNMTESAQPGQVLIVPAAAVAAMKVDLKDAARLAGHHIRQFFKELGF